MIGRVLESNDFDSMFWCNMTESRRKCVVICYLSINRNKYEMSLI